MTEFFLAVDNLRAQKTRTFLTALGIVFGVGSVIGMLSIGAGAREEKRTLFAVGDEKQSIYSFQGAEPRMFAAMGAHFATMAEEAGELWRQVPLDLSFRSVAPVLTALDQSLQPAIRELERLLADRRSDLDSATQQVVTTNLQRIDRSIAEIRAALARAPNDGALYHALAEAFQHKIAFLRRYVVDGGAAA